MSLKKGDIVAIDTDMIRKMDGQFDLPDYMLNSFDNRHQVVSSVSDYGTFSVKGYDDWDIPVEAATVTWELRNCPFCGYGHPLIYENYGVFRVECPNCQTVFKCDGTAGHDMSKEKTIQSWNRRPDDDGSI